MESMNIESTFEKLTLKEFGGDINTVKKQAENNVPNALTVLSYHEPGNPLTHPTIKKDIYKSVECLEKAVKYDRNPSNSVLRDLGSYYDNNPAYPETNYAKAPFYYSSGA